MAVVLVTMKMRFGLIEMRNTYHMESFVDTTNDAVSACNNIVGFYNTHLRFNLSNQWTLYGATYRNVSSPSLPTLEVPITPIVGQDSSDPLPSILAGLVWFKAFTAPPNSARKYIPGWVEVRNTSTGRPDASAQSAMAAFAQAFIDHNGSLAGSDYIYGTGKVDPVTDTVTAFNPWNTGGARDYWAVQRSRRT